MKLYARLPRNRAADGCIWLINDHGRIALGPELCRGEQPAGAYVVARVERDRVDGPAVLLNHLGHPASRIYVGEDPSGLRVPAAFLAQLADLVEAELKAHREVLYEATEGTPG